MIKRSHFVTLMVILSGFVVMSFCEIVSVSTAHIKIDFGLSDTASNLIPFVLFFMFFIFSAPTSILMHKIGRKKTVLASYILTIIALLIPIINYSFATAICCFALLGIANTVLQVSLNPLLTSLVSERNRTRSLTAGQLAKAIGELCIPPLVYSFAIIFGDWKIIFIALIVVTLISTSLLLSTSIKDESKDKTANIKTINILKLLQNKSLLVLFFGIICAVGLSVGMGVVIPKLLIEYEIADVNVSSYGLSLLYFGKIVGMLLGIFLLTKIKSIKLFKYTVSAIIIPLILLAFVRDQTILFILFFLIGLLVSNIFAIILSIAISIDPKNVNNISGLMITGVGGGAIITILMGIASDISGSQIGSIIVLLAAAFYLLISQIIIKNRI